MASDVPPGGQGAIPRFEQTFPTLTAAEVERLRRFGQIRRFADGEALLTAGEPSPGMFVIVSGPGGLGAAGRAGATDAAGRGGARPVPRRGGDPVRQARLVDARAEGELEAILIPPGAPARAC